jgi:hypothetical protein
VFGRFLISWTFPARGPRRPSPLSGNHCPGITWGSLRIHCSITLGSLRTHCSINWGSSRMHCPTYWGNAYMIVFPRNPGASLMTLVTYLVPRVIRVRTDWVARRPFGSSLNRRAEFMFALLGLPPMLMLALRSITMRRQRPRMYLCHSRCFC